MELQISEDSDAKPEPQLLNDLRVAQFPDVEGLRGLVGVVFNPLARDPRLLHTAVVSDAEMYVGQRLVGLDGAQHFRIEGGLRGTGGERGEAHQPDRREANIGHVNSPCPAHRRRRLPAA